MSDKGNVLKEWSTPAMLSVIVLNAIAATWLIAGIKSDVRDVTTRMESATKSVEKGEQERKTMLDLLYELKRK